MQAFFKAPASTLPPSHPVLELSMVPILTSSLSIWMAKKGTWCSWDSVFLKGVRELVYQCQETRHPAERTKRCPFSHLAGAPLLPFHLFYASWQSQPKMGPSKANSKQQSLSCFSFEAYHLSHPLPAKPQSSALACTGQWGRCSQRVRVCQPRGTLPTLHRNYRWLFCRWEPSEGCWARSSANWDTVKRLLPFPRAEEVMSKQAAGGHFLSALPEK